MNGMNEKKVNDGAPPAATAFVKQFHSSLFSVRCAIALIILFHSFRSGVSSALSWIKLIKVVCWLVAQLNSQLNSPSSFRKSIWFTSFPNLMELIAAF